MLLVKRSLPPEGYFHRKFWPNQLYGAGFQPALVPSEIGMHGVIKGGRGLPEENLAVQESSERHYGLVVFSVAASQCFRIMLVIDEDLASFARIVGRFVPPHLSPAPGGHLDL